ncbi:MAG: phenylalanine--tRNA ligase subunit beta, partial [Anaerolineae bacterium]|nr:phenylalanine--tRNA ligase subunit beta [Anaerolineae bacterium]
EVKGKTVRATVPDHRLDIGEGVTGRADLMEEVARIYGYENIPETRMADILPPQHNNPTLEFEETIRDRLTDLGLQEVITYRLTSPENEARRLAPGTDPDGKPYLELLNPISPERVVMRKSLLSSVLDIVERNARFRERIAIFEIGPVFLASEAGPLPDEQSRLVIALSGPRALPDWQHADIAPMDFFDLKGVVDSLLAALHLEDAQYEDAKHPAFHPGKTARIVVGDRQVAVLGELHPLVHQQYELSPAPLLAAAFNLDVLIELVPPRHEAHGVPSYPPVLEDLALVVDENIPAGKVSAMITQTGGQTLSAVNLFDVYRGEQVGAGKKSLAYSLTYQALDRTLTDKDVAKLRSKIVKRLEKELNAKLRE